MLDVFVGAFVGLLVGLAAASLFARSSLAAYRHRLEESSRFRDSLTTDLDALRREAAELKELRVRLEGQLESLRAAHARELDHVRDLADAINAQDGDIQASIINDGTKANAQRLVLSSAKTGRDFDVEIVANDTALQFDTKAIEAAFADPKNSSAYTGTATSSGTYTGTGSKTFIVEVLSAGAAGAATYRVSKDGGISWDDNGGAGYATSTTAAALGAAGEGVQLAFSDSGTLSSGDRFHVDVTSPELRAAQDAVFTLNGIKQTRSSNSISDGIEGVTFDLLKADPAKTLRFSVERDDKLIVDAVKEMVDAYNALVKDIRDKQTFDPETNTGGPFLGDRTANSVISTLRRRSGAPPLASRARFAASRTWAYEPPKAGASRSIPPSSKISSGTIERPSLMF
ncbi:MAG: flagellar filament capping protein FliD [Myxococcales bacterium]|nr:flagellar filament capping protein FliD [Myxococcales bacterium]